MKKSMNRNIVILLVLVAFVFPQIVSAEVYTTISGYVVEDGTGAPIAGQDITAVKMNSPKTVVLRGFTDAKGLYVIHGVTSGTYSVFLENLITNDYYSYKKSKEVVVAVGKNIVNNNYTVKQAGFVSGRVFEGDGITPYADVSVIASAEGGYQLSVATDESGFYKIGGLPDTEEAVVGALLSGVGIKYQKGIEIVGGTETKNIDFVLKKDASNLSIKGRVLSQTLNEPIENVVILIRGPESLAKVDTDANGVFKIYGLPPGIYDVMIAEFGYEFFSKEGLELKQGEIPLKIEFILKPESADIK